MDGDNFNDYETQMLRYLEEKQECLRFYKTKLSPNLNKLEKESLLWRMSNYRCEHHPLPDDNPVSEFPELEKYWEKHSLSMLELMTLEYELHKDVYGPEEECDVMWSK